MPSDLPKISVYLPPSVYRRLEEHKNENNIKSMSQTATMIIAQFLSVEYIAEKTIGGITLAEFNELKKKVEELEIQNKELLKYSSLLSDLKSNLPSKEDLQKLDKIDKIEEKIIVLEKLITLKIFHEKSLKVDLEPEYMLDQLSTLPMISIKEKELNSNVVSTEIQQKNNKPDKSVQETNLFSELPSDLPSDLLNNIEPLTGSLLAKRLNVNKATPANYKIKKSVNEFYEWSKRADPNNIGWIPNFKDKGYIPGDRLADELLSTLQRWITEIQGEKDSEFTSTKTKLKTKGININQLLDHTTESLEGDLSIT